MHAATETSAHPGGRAIRRGLKAAKPRRARLRGAGARDGIATLTSIGRREPPLAEGATVQRASRLAAAARSTGPSIPPAAAAAVPRL